MIVTRVLLLCLLVCVAKAQLTQNEKNRILNKHNQQRRQESYENGVVFMPEVEWDVGLSREAQIMTNKCEFVAQKGPVYKANYAYLKVKENFHLSQDFWLSLKSLFNLESSTCRSSPLACTPYLNIVNSYQLTMGCGRSHCEVVKGSPFKVPIHLLICLFDNGATTTQGKKFQRPFERQGAPCMNCRASTYNPLSGLCLRN